MNALEEINCMVKAAALHEITQLVVQFQADGNIKSAAPAQGISMEQVKNWIKFVKDEMGENLLTKPELLKSVAIGSAATGLAGLGIGALFSKKKNRKKRMLTGALIGALAGGVGGPAYAQLRKYLDGIPFDNSKFDASKFKKGDKVYIGVGGSANGEGHSWFMKNLRNGAGANRVFALRHVDRDKLENAFKDLTGRGLDVTLIGHSSGGATVGQFLKSHPEAKGVLLDPVSWTGRGVSDNAVVFTPLKSARNNPVFENVVANYGGRWNYEGPNSIMYNGDHSDNGIFTDYIFPMIDRGLNPKDLLGMRDKMLAQKK